MKLNKLVIKVLASSLFVLFPIAGYAQQQEEPDMDEYIEQEADRLQRILDLEDWQVFYVDSTLKHDFAAMVVERQELIDSKVANVSMYQAVNDKWMDQIDATYRKIFSDEQWAAYLKSGAGKAIKARQKRKDKAQKQ